MNIKKKALIIVSLIVTALLLIGAANTIGKAFGRNDQRNSKKSRNSQQYSRDSKNKNSEDSKNFSKGGKELIVGTIDNIDGDKITITLGSIEMDNEKEDTTENNRSFGFKDSEDSQEKELEDIPEMNEKSESKDMPDFTENYKEGTEKITLTVTDTALVEDFKAGDIVTIRYNDNNELTNISLLSDGPQMQGKNKLSETKSNTSQNTQTQKEQKTENSQSQTTSV